MPESTFVALIDGYNVIKQHPAWCRLPLAQARQQLITVLQQTRWPVPVARVELFFDSADPDVMGAGHDVATVRVRFTSPSADEAMQEAIRDSAHPRRLLVISNDQRILHTAKSHGARRFSVSWLMQRSQPREAVRPPGREAGRPSLTRSEIERINAELAKRWQTR